MTDNLKPCDLLDADGENKAVRMFLMLYGSTASPSIEGMRDHMEWSGFKGYWPAWAESEHGFLTKAGAQSWLRHLFSLESRTEPAVSAEPEPAQWTDIVSDGGMDPRNKPQEQS